MFRRHVEKQICQFDCPECELSVDELCPECGACRDCCTCEEGEEDEEE
jgi:hypothetical protein